MDGYQGHPPANQHPEMRYGEPLDDSYRGQPDDSYRGPQDDSFRGQPPSGNRFVFKLHFFFVWLLGVECGSVV